GPLLRPKRTCHRARCLPQLRCRAAQEPPGTPQLRAVGGELHRPV
ncbi:Endonuclease, Uma2 family, partial [uncultured Leptolyngbya sp.]